MFDLRYTGKAWIFCHEPYDVFEPLVCNCEEGERWMSDPEYQHKSMQVSLTECMLPYAWTVPREWPSHNIRPQMFGHEQVEWFTIAPHVATLVQKMLHQNGYNKDVQW